MHFIESGFDILLDTSLKDIIHNSLKFETVALLYKKTETWQ